VTHFLRNLAHISISLPHPPLTHAAMQCTSLQGSTPRCMQCVCTSPSSALDLDSSILPFLRTMCAALKCRGPSSHYCSSSQSHLISNLVCTWHTTSYIASQIALILICFTQFLWMENFAIYKHRMFHIIYLCISFPLIQLPPLGWEKKFSRLSLSSGSHMP
jgi:hypothetical protein